MFSPLQFAPLAFARKVEQTRGIAQDQSGADRAFRSFSTIALPALCTQRTPHKSQSPAVVNFPAINGVFGSSKGGAETVRIRINRQNAGCNKTFSHTLSLCCMHGTKGGPPKTAKKDELARFLHPPLPRLSQPTMKQTAPLSKAHRKGYPALATGRVADVRHPPFP